MSLKYKLTRLLSRKPVAKINSFIDKTARVGNGAQIVNSSIGKYSYVYNSKIIMCSIGSFCSIGEDCIIGGGKHPLNWISTSPVFCGKKNVMKVNFSKNPYDEYEMTTIGNDVWIGSKCLIKGGVKIGNGAVIGMGSVVTHDVPPFEIWAGNPARLIRKRFDDDTISIINKSQWWNWDKKLLREYGDLFNDVEKFIKGLE